MKKLTYLYKKINKKQSIIIDLDYFNNKKRRKNDYYNKIN